MAASSAFMIAEESGSRSRDYKGSEFGEPGHIGSTPRPHRRGGRGLSEPKEIFSDYPQSPPVRANFRRSATPGRNRARQQAPGRLTLD